MDVIDPDARIADLVGLLYVLNNIFNGKTDLYKLEKEMEVDIDDLMPIVYTAERLGLVAVESGDINISDKGREYIKSGMIQRKKIINNSLRDIEPFKTAIELKSFSLDDILEKLKDNGVQTFNNPDGLHDLEVILIEWGVYSRLLKKTDDGFEVNTQDQS
ncbi:MULTISPECIES: AAA-associated domain-containing protein [Acidiplasma]|uniref:ABC transporter ATP-binding protein n=2 Tax=Acidiplasma TaxID=507753 RepID=A0A0Q0VU50_9ARCH|nr:MULTISPECIES: AAA-associated domain-containing protein [Acidiplasma]KJE48836.1 ABC transporter ATP-binding protein [Acidiplasma sp. MBA-1]KPV45822.1 ABC transporter ATP-binding protein [Acidiplasma aeolicum]KQB34408.1 ABC transporter ATP-binding protein [Acidiplasma aeolicum]KQB35142.1 ABC transporter ATP-binding protein [Acidiplasma cupricumulans]WMT54232.1 MAG: AAA-associated domain-containing protein [Acidiplasma sp.]